MTGNLPAGTTEAMIADYFDADSDGRPMNEDGYRIGPDAARRSKINLAGWFNELDQMAAEMRDSGETTLSEALMDYRRRVGKRIWEVSDDRI
jgi:hypothetical protein